MFLSLLKYYSSIFIIIFSNLLITIYYFLKLSIGEKVNDVIIDNYLHFRQFLITFELIFYYYLWHYLLYIFEFIYLAIVNILLLLFFLKYELHCSSI